MRKEYRIQHVKVPVHGLKNEGFLKPVGYELFRREKIKLISMGIYNSEEEAIAVANKHAHPNKPTFV